MIRNVYTYVFIYIYIYMHACRFQISYFADLDVAER